MKYSMQIILLCILAKIQEIEMITVSNKRVTVTVHDYDQTWNDAQSVCVEQGGRLYVEDSEERTIVLEKYKTGFNLKEDLYIGLHYPTTSTNDIFAWTNCFWIEYRNYKDAAEPKDTNSKKCTQSDKNGLGWKTHQCDHAHRFVCETQGADCSYNQRTGIPTDTADFTDVTITTVDETACEATCLTKINNNQNCWGLNFFTALGSNNCVLYFTNDPFYFTESATYDGSGVRMSIKDCYSDALDTTDNTVLSEEDKSDTPNGICSSYTDQTTTTAAPSTTTTTAAPTTTTTTAAAPTTTTTTAAPTTTTTTAAAPTTTTTTAAPTTTTTTAAPTTTTSTAAPTTSTTTAAPTTTTTTAAAPTTTTTTAAPTTTTTTAAPTTTTSTAAPTTTTTTAAAPTTTTTTAAPTTTTTTAAPTTTTSTAAPTTITSTAAPPTTTTTTASPTTAISAHTATTAAATTTTTPDVPTTAAITTASTTTSSSTTVFVKTTGSACTCDCSDLSKYISNYQSDPAWLNMTTEEKVASLVLKLRVDKTILSATVRKKTSAQDNRAFSKSVGYVSIAFMSVVLGLMVFSDALRFLRYITKKKEISFETLYHKEEKEEVSIL